VCDYYYGIMTDLFTADIFAFARKYNCIKSLFIISSSLPRIGPKMEEVTYGRRISHKKQLKFCILRQIFSAQR
jgi:hypothetical protein